MNQCYSVPHALSKHVLSTQSVLGLVMGAVSTVGGEVLLLSSL